MPPVFFPQTWHNAPMLPLLPFLVLGFIVFAFLCGTSLKVLREYERAIVFRLGRARAISRLGRGSC